MAPVSSENGPVYESAKIEQGMNWRIDRQAFDPEKAARACEEIASTLLEVIEVETGRLFKRKTAMFVPRPGCEKFVAMQDRPLGGMQDVFSFNCRVIPSETRDSVLNHRDIASKIPTLLSLYEQARSDIDIQPLGFIINLYKPGGIFPQHQDINPVPTKSLNLQGSRTLYLKDPATKVAHEFKLKVGDSFELQNPIDIAERPWHALENKSFEQLSVGFIV